MKWHQEPFSRLNRLAESVIDGQVDLCCAEQAVKDVFESSTVQVVQLVGRNDLHVSQRYVASVAAAAMRVSTFPPVTPIL